MDAVRAGAEAAKTAAAAWVVQAAREAAAAVMAAKAQAAQATVVAAVAARARVRGRGSWADRAVMPAACRVDDWVVVRVVPRATAAKRVADMV